MIEKIRKIEIIKHSVKRNNAIQVDEDLLIKLTEPYRKDRSKSLSVQLNGFPVQLIQIREYGELTHKAFYLSNQYNWIVVEDDQGETCLVPLKK